MILVGFFGTFLGSFWVEIELTPRYCPSTKTCGTTIWRLFIRSISSNCNRSELTQFNNNWFNWASGLNRVLVIIIIIARLDTAVWMNSRSNWWRSCSWVVAHLRWMGLSLMHQYLGALVGCRWYWYRLIADTEWGQRQVVGAATMQPSAHWHSAGWWKWLGRKCNDWRFRRCPPTSIFL